MERMVVGVAKVRLRYFVRQTFDIFYIESRVGCTLELHLLA